MRRSTATPLSPCGRGTLAGREQGEGAHHLKSLLSRCGLALISGYLLLTPSAVADEPAGKQPVIPIEIRFLEPADGAAEAVEKTDTRSLVPAETAILICDTWNKHWCASATRRCDALAKQMAPLVELARARGVHIIHAPSDTLDAYRDHPARRAHWLRLRRLPLRRSAAGVRWKRPVKASCPSMIPTAAATVSRSANRARPGVPSIRRFVSTRPMSSPTTARRCTTTWWPTASRTSCTWAYTPTCACSAVRSASARCRSWASKPIWCAT